MFNEMPVNLKEICTFDWSPVITAEFGKVLTSKVSKITKEVLFLIVFTLGKA
jgi:hypothetical protein